MQNYVNYSSKADSSTMSVSQRAESDYFSHIEAKNEKGILKEAFIINIILMLLLFISVSSQIVAFVGGFFIITYFSITALSKPQKAFFLIFGTKLTFDTLWQVKFDETIDLEIKLLELFMIPVIMTSVIGLILKKTRVKLLIPAVVIYLLWIILAILFNEVPFDYKLLIRQSGILWGLLLGLRFIKHENQFRVLAYAIIISTFFPVLASFTQIVIGNNDIPFFHYKLDSTREVRLSGLYYDAGSAGMMAISSLLSGFYLLYTDSVKGKVKYLCILIFMFSLFIIFIGGTRSMIVVSSLILVAYMLRYLKKTIFIIPLIGIMIFFAKPQLDKAVSKSVLEMQKGFNLTQMLEETEYRTLFTGRVSIWQDIWETYNSGTFLQMLFGYGLSSNAHSSYFFLLLELGILGLLFYLLLHALLFYKILQLNSRPVLKLAALSGLASILLVGISLTTVIYTSYQWIIYLIVGGAINISLYEEDNRYSIIKR